MKKTIYLLFTFALTFVFQDLSAQYVSLLAGGTGTGTANGITIAAKFNAPSDLCVNSIGQIFIVDRNNNVIRKIDEYGVSSVFAGSGTPGFANGTGTSASFNFPIGICIDASDNLYVADFGNNRIRQITPSQVVSTWAGTGAYGSTNGAASSATFQGPSGLCFDGSGNMFITEYSGNRVRKLSSGVVSNFATGIFNPWDICMGSGGNLFVTNMGTDQVHKITPAGVVSVFAGSGSTGNLDGVGTAASFNDLAGICYNGTSLFVADASNNLIREISSTGLVSTYAGNGTAALVNGIGTTASFNSPNSVAFDQFGNLLVADALNHAIRSICISATPTFTTNISNDNFCLGSATTFSANGSNSWFNFGWTNGIVNGTAYTPSVAGVYTATVVGLSYTNGCTNQNTVTYTVNSTPTVSVSNGTICSGNSFTISPTGATSYTYSSGGAIVSPTATSVYSVTGSNGVCAQTKTLNVTVNQLPVLSGAASSTLCSGNWYQFAATGATSYTFASTTSTLNATTSNTFFATTNSITPTSSITYTVTGNISGGCVSNPIITNITVNTTPTITANNGTICAGSSFTINPSGATSYTYSGGSAVVAPTTNTTYVITGANGNCSSTKNVTVTVNPLPATYINSGSPNFTQCAGTNVEVQTMAANPAFYSTINGVQTTINSSYNYTVDATYTQTYTTVVTNTITGCSKTLATFTVTVPSATLDVNSSNANLCSGQSAVLTVSASAGSTSVNQITWYPGPFGLGSSSVSVNPTSTTVYTVTAQDQSGYGCNFSAIITQSVSTCTGIEEATTNNLISIYPNPANDFIIVDFSTTLESMDNKIVYVINALGEIVVTEKIISNHTTLKTENLASGIYFVKLEGKNSSAIKKFIKQ